MAHFGGKLSKVINAPTTNKKGYRLPSTINNIDLKIFENPNDTKCSRHSDHIPITEQCAHTLRLCTASRYVDAIMSSKLDEDMKRTLFVEFNEVVYDSVLEDTTHFVAEHSNDIQRVHDEWTQRYGMKKCSVSECTKTARHYGRGRREQQSKGQDAVHSFYRSLYDRVHHYIFHLFDIGLRVDMSSFALNAGGDDEKERESKGVTVDEFFAAERDQIQSQRDEANMDLDRFDEENNKFTIQMVAAMEGAVTLMDALFKKLAGNQVIRNEAVQRLSHFVDDNSFDSECIEMDIEDLKDSNICTQIQSQIAIEMMADFIRTTKCMFTCFSHVVMLKLVG